MKKLFVSLTALLMLTSVASANINVTCEEIIEDSGTLIIEEAIKVNIKKSYLSRKASITGEISYEGGSYGIHRKYNNLPIPKRDFFGIGTIKKKDHLFIMSAGEVAGDRPGNAKGTGHIIREYTFNTKSLQLTYEYKYLSHENRDKGLTHEVTSTYKLQCEKDPL